LARTKWFSEARALHYAQISAIGENHTIKASQPIVQQLYYNRVHNKSYGNKGLPSLSLSELPKAFFQHFSEHKHATLKGVQTPMVMQELEDLHRLAGYPDLLHQRSPNRGETKWPRLHLMNLHGHIHPGFG